MVWRPDSVGTLTNGWQSAEVHLVTAVQSKTTPRAIHARLKARAASRTWRGSSGWPWRLRVASVRERNGALRREEFFRSFPMKSQAMRARVSQLLERLGF